MSHSPTPSSQTSAPSLGGIDPHANLVAHAKAEAMRLRSEAIRDFGTHAFANFWREANTVWQHLEASAGSASRSARHLQARLNRRQVPTHSA